MKKILLSVMLVLTLSTLVFGAALAEMGDPQGSCPPPFHLHMAHDHDEHHGAHLHAGTDADLNADGWICVYHATPSEKVHVHIDNNLP